MGKLGTEQGEDYSTGCLIDYEYIKNHCRLIAVDINRQKELDAYPKGIRQKKFVGKVKHYITVIMLNVCLS